MSEAQILMAVFEYLDFFLGIVCWKGATFFNEERGLFLSGGFKKKTHAMAGALHAFSIMGNNFKTNGTGLETTSSFSSGSFKCLLRVIAILLGRR